MEYFLGSLITLATLYFAVVMNKGKMPKQKSFIRYTQAYKMEGLKDVFKRINTPKPRPKTQATEFNKSNSTRVLFLQDSAYWIRNNALYMADMVDGKVDEESTRTVDTMGMDKVQLDKTIFIVSKLTEGLDDDRSNTGN